jgi:hypothetical protein
MAARNEDPSAGEQFAAAVATMRTKSTPFHCAHGLLDYAEYLRSTGRDEESVALIAEATQIGERLGAGSLVLRSTDLAGQSGSLLTS